MIVAGYAHRYEPPHLIEELRENLAWVDGFAAYDDSDNPAVWSPAKPRNEAVRRAARAMGARWLLFTAPDERWDYRAADLIRSAVARQPNARFSFPLREMWTPTEYRIDGVWGMKRRMRLTRVDRRPSNHPAVFLDVPIYHLKMIEPANRAERARVHTEHNKWDNRAGGFAYLADERGLVTETIAADRGYLPPYRAYEFSIE